MKVLIIGVVELIYSQLISALLKEGHEVIFFEKNKKKFFWIGKICFSLSLKEMKNNFEEIKAIINLEKMDDSSYEKNKDILFEKVLPLLKRNGLAGEIKKVIHLIPISQQEEKFFCQLNQALKEKLLNSSVQALVLKYSLVYGDGTFKEERILSALAALPKLAMLVGNGQQRLQPIHIQDFSKAINVLLTTEVNQFLTLKVVGPDSYTLKEILSAFSDWLGSEKRSFFSIPFFLIRVNNFLKRIGITTSSYRFFMKDETANFSEVKQFYQYVQFQPKRFLEKVSPHAATLAQRLYARLYYLKSLVRLGVAFIWLFTAICTLFFYPKEASYILLEKVGISDFWEPILLYGAIGVDAILGLLMLFNYQLTKICKIQFFLILFYSGIIAWRLPSFWLEPFQPISKNIILLIALVLLMAMEESPVPGWKKEKSIN